MRSLCRGARRQAGFSLIEVLISLLVISVGLLSIASLQLLSKRSTYDAAQRTTAALLADDMLSRMRNNPGALINYLPGAIGSATGATLAQPAALCEEGTTCTAEELATWDLWQWEQFLDGMQAQTADNVGAGGLVAPMACFVGPAFGGNGTYTLAIAWRGMTPGTSPGTSDCGAGSGNYGDADEYRRVLVVSTFIAAS